jgi:hypothetical protein
MIAHCDDADNGHLPKHGGMLDQTACWRQFYRLVKNEQAKIEAERLKK